MMNLVTQFIILFFSFCFGVFLFFIFKINYKYLIIRRYKLRIFFYVSIFLFISILYFVILRFLNNGILHLYFLLLIIFGFLITYNFYKKKRK